MSETVSMITLLNPVVGILHNTKLNRWHPVVFREAPLPGPPSPGKPVRHRSLGHHTSGFDMREAAIQNAEAQAELMKPQAVGGVALALDKDFAWDGEEVPAMTVFFAIIDGVAKPLF